MFTSICYKPFITRGNHNQRDQTNMIRKTLIFLLVALELFLFASFQTGIKLFFLSSNIICCLNHEKILTMAYQLAVNRIEITLTK